MGSGVTVRADMRGVEQFRGDIADLRGGGLIDGAMREVERGLLAVAAAFAPRRTGRLSNATVSTSTPFRASLSNRLVYAQPIHWGWPRRNIAAQPWLQNAARATEPAWLEIIATAVQRSLDNVKGT